MVSELQKQLKLIRNPEFVKGTGKGQNKGKQVPSFLFDRKTAARNDFAAVHELGTQGFKSLLSFDHRFLEFHETFFGEQNIEQDRVLRTKAWNAELDLKIGKFLRLLSKYFLMRPAGLVLEWLIRRFRINEFNVEGVLACILPYYETNEFLLMLRPLFFESYPRWQFLVAVRKSERPLTREFLVRHLRSDLSLLNFVCQTTQQYFDDDMGFSTLINFYITTLVEFLEPENAKDHNALTILVPGILHGLFSSQTEYKLCTYLILSQLSHRVNFSARALSQMLSALFSNPVKDWKQLSLCLLSLAQSQSLFVDSIMEFDLGLLFSEPARGHLIEMSKKFNCEALHKSILLHFVERQAFDALNEFLTAAGLEISAAALESAFLALLKLVEKEKEVEKVTSIFAKVHGRYGTLLEQVVSRFISKRNDTHVFKLIQQCLGTTTHAIVQDTGTPILLAVQHPNDEFSLAGIKQLLDVLKQGTTTLPTEDATLLATAVANCLRRSENIRNVILESDIVLSFLAQFAGDHLAESLLWMGAEYPSKNVVHASALAITRKETGISSNLRSQLELMLLHFSILEKEWTPRMETNLPVLTLESIKRLLSSDAFAKSGLVVVSKANFPYLFEPILALFTHEQENLRKKAIELALSHCTVEQLGQVMLKLFSMPEKEFNHHAKDLQTRFPSFDFLLICARGLQDASSNVVLRSLNCIREKVIAEPKDYQSLLAFLLPCCLNSDPTIRKAVKHILYQIDQALSKFDLESKDTSKWPEPLPPLGYEMSKVTFVKPKVLSKWFKSTLAIDFGASEENAQHLSFRKKFDTVLIAFLSHIPMLSFELQTQWLRLLQTQGSCLVVSTLHKHYKRLFFQLEGKPDQATIDLIIQFIRGLKSSISTELFRMAGVFDTLKQFLSKYGAPEFESVQLATLHLVQRNLWMALSNEQQYELFNLLLTIVSKSKISANVLEVKAALTRVPLAEELVARFLTTFVAMKQKDEVGTGIEQPKKRQRMKTRNKHMSKLIALLELLKYKPFEAYHVLVMPLFQALDLVLQFKPRQLSTEEIHHQHEFITQLILSDLLLADMSTLNETVFRVELLVECLRSSDNPQTHNSALIVLSKIAPLCPDKVLLNIMPIFTFMGAHISKQDDEFSFNTIESTIKSIVPSLTLDAVHVQQAVQVFVDTVLHIPVHRRLRLFMTLVQTLGEEQLFMVVLLLLEKNLQELFEFALLVSSEFSERNQLNSMIKLVKLINLQNRKLKTPSKPEPQALSLSPPLEESLKMNGVKKNVFRSQAPSMVESQVAPEVSFSANLEIIEPAVTLKVKPLVLKFVNENLTLRTFADAFNKTVPVSEARAFIQTLLEFVQSNKVEKELLSTAHTALNKIQTLLPIREFVKVMCELWAHDSLDIVKKALRLFHERLMQLNGTSVNKHRLALLNTVQIVCQTLQHKCNDTEIILLCFSLLQQLCIRYGSQHPDEFLTTLDIITAYFQPSKSKRAEVSASAYACFAHYITHLQQRLIKYFNSAMQNSFLFFNSIHNQPLHRLSIYLFWEQSITHLHAFLSPFLPTLLPRLLDFPMPKNVLVTEKVTSIAKLLGEKVENRILLPSIYKYLADINKQGKEVPDTAFVLLIETMKPLLQRMNKQDILQNHATVFDRFFLVAFSSSHYPDTLIGSCLVTFIMKLNEALFRPLFQALLEWTEKDVSCRLKSLFRVCQGLFPHLRHLFISYFLNTLSLLEKALQRPSMPTSSVALSALTLACKFDQEKSLAPHAAKLVPLISHCFESDAEASEKAIVQLALALPQDETWRWMLTYLVDLLCDGKASQRKQCTALKCIGQLYESVGEPFLTYLPETLPALAECLENEDLETTASQVVSQIEQVLGEPLQKYLQK